MPGIHLTSLATSRTADCKLVVKHAFPAVMVSCFLTSVIRGDSKSWSCWKVIASHDLSQGLNLWCWNEAVLCRVLPFFVFQVQSVFYHGKTSMKNSIEARWRAHLIWCILKALKFWSGSCFQELQTLLLASLSCTWLQRLFGITESLRWIFVVDSQRRSSWAGYLFHFVP